MHTHLFASSFLGTIAARVARASIVVCHGHSGPEIYNQHPLFGRFILRPLQRLQALFVDHYITVSSEVYDFHRSILGRPRSKVHVTRNWFLRTQLASVECHWHRAIWAELGIPHNHLVVGSVGRLSSEKGYYKLLHEFSRCLPMRQDLSLILAGQGDQKNMLDQFPRILEILFMCIQLGNRTMSPPFTVPLTSKFNLLTTKRLGSLFLMQWSFPFLLSSLIPAD